MESFDRPCGAHEAPVDAVRERHVDCFDLRTMWLDDARAAEDGGETSVEPGRCPPAPGEAIEPRPTAARTSRAEAEVRNALARGDLTEAATVAIRRYGPELFGFLLSMHDEVDASDVFAATTEAMWRSLPSFEQRSSLRTWLYVLARSQSARHRRGDARRRARFESLEARSPALDVAAEVRSTTLSCLKSGPRSISALRELLSPEDRELLVLRVDRELSFLELAEVFLGEGATDAALTREAARLRKRFAAVRARLLLEGRARGMLPGPAGGR